MIDGSEKHNRQLAFELQNSHVCEKRSKKFCSSFSNWYFKFQICYLLHKFTVIGIMIKSSIVWMFTVFIEMQQYTKAQGTKNFVIPYITALRFDILKWDK